MDTVTSCPKCGFTSDVAFSDCPGCGVIVSKFLKRQKELEAIEEAEDTATRNAVENLNSAQSLVIKQKKEWGEILTGFETRNKYSIMDGWGHEIFQAEEEGGSLGTVLGRLFLNHLRPFTISIFSTDGNEMIVLDRPFRFYFHELDIRTPDGVLLGKVKRRFALLRRNYAILDANEREIFQIFGPILRPWTFLIKKDEQEQGKIVKKWSGMGKEIFTDADNFGINFPQEADADQKAVFLGALFLIDFVHFEKKQN
jgi:uncharacterized protein YxjI